MPLTSFVGTVDMEKRQTKGFTLIELLVTLGLFSIIVASVTPSIGNFYKRNRVAAIINDHSAALQLARHTAITENVFVVVCPTDDMATCSSDWSKIKMVFVDEDNDGALDGDEEVIGSAEMVNDYSIESTRDNLRFAPFNTAENLTATITICPDETSNGFARALVVSNVGRVRIERDRDEIDCGA